MKRLIAGLVAATMLLSMRQAEGDTPGYLAAWGMNDSGQTVVPAGDDFTRIAAGYAFNIALKADRSLVAWGADSWGSTTNVPGGNDYVSIAAGFFHGLALRENGSLVGWGHNGEGQSDVPSGTDYADIAGGGLFSLALKTDGSLLGWGRNYSGETNVPSGDNYIDIAAGYEHGLALRSDGSIAAWGSNDWGQTNVPTGNDFVAVAAGNYFGVALKCDGSLAAWGWNSVGQCEVPAGNDFIAISSMASHSLAMRADGSLVAWGANEYGQCDVPGFADDYLAFAAGGKHSLVLLGDASAVPKVSVFPFYNNSAWDNGDGAANEADDYAIATDKVALRHGMKGTFTNYTSYSKGINGLMIDVQGLPGTPTLNDFLFRKGNNEKPCGNDLDNPDDDWPWAPDPIAVTVRPGEGRYGTDRVTLIWEDGVIRKCWLQVTVLATDATGLAENEVFYVGNAIADSGNSLTDTAVNVADALGVRANPHTLLRPAPIDDAYDYNRDGMVNVQDELIVRANPTTLLTDLNLIDLR